MNSILPHKHIENSFGYTDNGDELTIYEQNINDTFLGTDLATSSNYDLLFYMYQMNAQEAINSYHDSSLDGNIGDFSLMLF